MPDMTMQERVARAICAAYNGMELVDIYVDHHWRNYIPEARAAIEAMREPTPGMVSAGEAKLIRPSAVAGRTHADYAADQWRAMIDAALKAKEEGNG